MIKSFSEEVLNLFSIDVDTDVVSVGVCFGVQVRWDLGLPDEER